MPYPFLSDEFLNKLSIADWGYTENSQATSYNLFQNWVEKGDVGALSYLEGERGLKREDVKKYFPQFQSALVFVFPYYQTKKNLETIESNVKIASYVHGFEGQDYHQYLRERLGVIRTQILKEFGDIEVGFTLDTQPVLERDLAYRAGLGWFGKNSMLISRSQGSYFIIGSLLLSQKLEVETSNVSVDHCGHCTACIDKCPTDAINSERQIVADKCISTYTIELFKDAPAPTGFQESNGEIFGCDICQEVCPWNEKKLKQLVSMPIENKLIDFFYKREPSEVVEDLGSMTNRGYKREFKGTPLERTGRVGMLKNLKKFFGL